MLTLRGEDGRVICEQVQVADGMLSRARGLLGRRSLPPGTGIVLRPGWSIHTAFMRFPIDVVFLGEDQVVRRIDPALGAFRMASSKGSREVVELAAGECARQALAVGERVTWTPYVAAPPSG